MNPTYTRLGALVTVLAVALVLVTEAAAGTPAEVPTFAGPIVITPTGQTPESLTLGALLDRLQIPYTHDPMLVPRKLEGYNTLMLAMGASLKGLGAAGIDQQEELQRDHMVVDAAREKGMSVIAVHIGGTARRNAIADRFITPFVPKADLILVLREGNQDGLFTQLSEEHGLPLVEVDDFVQLLGVLAAMFAAP